MINWFKKKKADVKPPPPPPPQFVGGFISHANDYGSFVGLPMPSLSSGGMWSGPVEEIVTASGIYIGINDDAFMSECWRRAEQSKSTEKCDLCELRFKCYTQRGTGIY